IIRAVENFRLGGALGWHFGGHNLSADREHVLTWTAGIEPRVYPKSSTRFIRSAGAAANGYEGETEDTMLFSENVLVSQEPLYAHLKYCKRNPGSNQSPEFRKELESRITIGNSRKMYKDRFHPDRIHGGLVENIRALIPNR
ncbi:MAG: hypothetical protein ACKOJB_01300, partial [Chthoniobacterales bacterium]